MKSPLPTPFRRNKKIEIGFDHVGMTLPGAGEGVIPRYGGGLEELSTDTTNAMIATPTTTANILRINPTMNGWTHLVREECKSGIPSASTRNCCVPIGFDQKSSPQYLQSQRPFVRGHNPIIWPPHCGQIKGSIHLPTCSIGLGLMDYMLTQLSFSNGLGRLITIRRKYLFVGSTVKVNTTRVWLGERVCTRYCVKTAWTSLGCRRFRPGNDGRNVRPFSYRRGPSRSLEQLLDCFTSRWSGYSRSPLQVDRVRLAVLITFSSWHRQQYRRQDRCICTVRTSPYLP